MLGSLAAAELFPAGFFEGIEHIVPVPMHFFKRARRGYNQTFHIAKGVSAATGISVSNLLKATRPHRTQTSLSREERLANTESLFAVKPALPAMEKGYFLLTACAPQAATIASAAEAITDALPEAGLSILTIGVTF